MNRHVLFPTLELIDILSVNHLYKAQSLNQAMALRHYQYHVSLRLVGAE